MDGAANIIQFQLSCISIDIVSTIQKIYYYLCYGIKDILKDEHFNLQFSRFLETQCKYQNVKWDIINENQEIVLKIHFVRCMCMIYLKVNTINKSAHLTVCDVQKSISFGWIDPLKIQFTLDNMDFIAKVV